MSITEQLLRRAGLKPSPEELAELESAHDQLMAQIETLYAIKELDSEVPALVFRPQAANAVTPRRRERRQLG
jgi:hypothetical protein